MSRFNYTDDEKRISKVLKYQDNRLREIEFPDTDSLEANIADSEALLKSLGYDLHPDLPAIQPKKKVLRVPSWEELCAEAETAIHGDCDLETIFTEEELKQNSEVIAKMREEFNTLHRLDKYDIAISAVAGIVSAAVDILMVGIPGPSPEGLTAGTLSNYIRAEFEKKFPPGALETSVESKVPYDAQDNRNTRIHVEGLSAYYHRMLSLGHDPLLGFAVGVFDIMTGRMTTIDKTGKFVSQVMDVYSNRRESKLFEALAKQVIHFKSDITTSMGLPAPLMGLFNLLQFGSIAEEEQTIAEIVQGMYYEGYDFIHFCSMSIPVMLTEVIVRLSYAFKRIKEGYPVKESIPFSTNREKHPKLSTMLFIGHSGATAINAGKVAFTKNPMAINYPQWIAFAKYSYSQLKWVLQQKPELQKQYVEGQIEEDLHKELYNIENTFDSFSKDYLVVFSE